MRVGRIIQIIVGAMILVAGLGVTGAGAGLIWANATQRDAQGYFMSPVEPFRADGVALVSSVDFAMKPGPNSWISLDPLGTLRVRASLATGPTFLGIAPTSDVDRYLAGAAHSEVTSVSVLPFAANYREVSGSRSVAAPTTKNFWVASSSGTGERTISWHSTSGKWSLVVMRADAHSGVAARVSVGTNPGLVLPVGVGLVVGGVLALVGGGLMIGFGATALARRRHGERVAPAAAPAPGTPAPAALEPTATVPGTYPARLDGHLEGHLSRWLWLVKWFLVIPHLFVLVFLWIAAIALTVLAGVSILVTGRYPRAIFDYVVGVIRWTWRVVFYSFSALATDVYPPFTLASDASFPADFSIDYPERLSRGLVLIKWWLLAIPQYIVVAILTGGGFGVKDHFAHSWSFATGGGVIGVLTIAAAVVLLVTGAYPTALFDVIMGLNRWCYRVMAYVLLLTDEYPPFRFDGGGRDPGTAPTGGGEPGPVGA
ncbi:MAG TPA: DUF4389 domain-containing protein, partial [Acidimicrobiales bacterium]|nr:DUF4389 domain-containing protein [Acidimicrobiales bacterium]